MTEKLSIRIIFIGLLIFFISIILFLWKDSSFLLNKEINADKFNQFGGFIAGVVGTLWSLASLILFYVTLKEQRKDFENNTKAVMLQVTALEQQIAEFELQRNELEETRKVFQEQTLTQQKQRFESTFFQLLNLHNQIVSSIDITANSKTYNGRDCFKHLYEKLKYAAENRARRLHQDKKEEIDILEVYNLLFDRDHSDLGHYFRQLYHIFKFVKNSDLDESEKKKYTNFVRAQLSSYELLMLYYNCLSDYGFEKFKPIVEEFSLLKNINHELILQDYQCQRSFNIEAFS